MMECEPTARALVAKVALPVASRVPAPRVVVLSVKVTVPVGTVPAGTVVLGPGVTEAVKVRVVPLTAVVAEAVRAVVVGRTGGEEIVIAVAEDALLLKAVGVVAPP